MKQAIADPSTLLYMELVLLELCSYLDLKWTLEVIVPEESRGAYQLAVFSFSYSLECWGRTDVVAVMQTLSSS